jgi:hypothetical protein
MANEGWSQKKKDEFKEYVYGEDEKGFFSYWVNKRQGKRWFAIFLEECRGICL